MKVLPRLSLAFAGLILAVGGFMHARAFAHAVAAVSASSLEPFYGNSLKALWLIDSVTLFVLAAVFGLCAMRRGVASRPIIVLLACIPAAIAFFQYMFLGGFIPAHAFVVAAIAGFFGAFGATSQEVAGHAPVGA